MSASAFELKVSSAGKRAILRFDRKKMPGLPEGETWVIALSEKVRLHMTFSFVKIACNKATLLGETRNLLTDLLQSWFGPQAGQPGTHHRVILRRADDHWTLEKGLSL